MADRYCRNCGQELREGDSFCPNCGRSTVETAHVPTPEADVLVPPLPRSDAGNEGWSTTRDAHTPQAGGAPSRGNRGLAGGLFVGCIVIMFGLFALFVATAIVGGGSGSGGSAGGGDNRPAGAPPGQGGQQGDAAESKQANPGGGMETAVVEVGGTPGMRFTGDVGNLDTSRSVDGVTPAEYEVEFSTDAWDLDSVYVSFYKEMDANANYPRGTLSAQIVVDGEVVQEASSSARDGYLTMDWSPSD